jgi:hypothetical protein
MKVITVDNAPPVPDGPAPTSGTGEPRYTLAEARRLLAERECREHGCDLQQQRYADGSTTLVFCERCGLTFEPPILPALPPENELREDIFTAGGHSSFRLTHITTGLVAVAGRGVTGRANKLRAERLLRARLLVAQLEEEAR